MCDVFHSSKLSKFWHRRSKLEKVGISLYLMLVMVATLLALYMKIIQNKVVCETSDCETAVDILMKMDKSTEPCDDFYQFACGNFIKYTPIPIGEVEVNAFTTLQEEVNAQLQTIIEDDSEPNESKVFALVKNFYKSCMNRTAVEALGLEPFHKILRQIGGWPAVEGDRWNESAWDLIQSLQEMRDLGLNTDYLLTTSVGEDLKNASTRSIQVDQPTLEPPREFLVNEQFKQRQLEGMVNMTVFFGANSTTAKDEMLEVLNFERALANISLAPEERRNLEDQFNPHTIAELEVKYPYIKWVDYFKALMPKSVKLTQADVIVVATPSYFERLADILENTSNRTIANYFAWQTFVMAEPFLNDEARLQLNPQLAVQSQSKKCILEINSIKKLSLLPPLGSLYMRKYFSNKSKHQATEIVENIRGSFIEILHNVTWMDEKTNSAAIEKAKAIVAHVAFPEELMNDTILESFYESLEIKDDEYLMNELRLNKFMTDYAFQKLHEPVDRMEWFPLTTMINAFYLPQKNVIQLPAAILQGTFLSEDRPNYMNYGAIGQIIGHEITHGFDDEGRQFDLNGHLKDWWMPETKSMFLQRTKCIIEQYGNFTEPKLNMKINGKRSQGENVADNAGMKSAYVAYKKWLANNNVGLKLPGLEQYSSEQMFWISAAQTWCSKSRDWYTKLLIMAEDHTLNRFRVIGSVQNNKDFARDFNCAPGSPMNPTEKCEIW